MAQTKMDRLSAFIARWTASRAETKEPALNKEKGQNELRPALLYSRLVALGACPERSEGSLASVALSSIQAMGVYHPINPSRRGHLYFAD